MLLYTTTITAAAVLFSKPAIIIAILSQKTFNWQLNKVIRSCMYNYNERMKKVEIRKRIGAIHLHNYHLQYLKLWLRFQIELSL